MKRENIIVLDFGGQYKQLIARRVRECHVYCEIHPHTMPVEELKKKEPKGIILTGGPNSVYGEEAVLCDQEIFHLGIPVLGICYGSQLMAQLLGGEVKTAPVSEYGKTEVRLGGSALFQEIPEKSTVWMSHTDYIAKVPDGFQITGNTKNCPVAAMENAQAGLYAVQF
ncbi:MAG: glutamine-hydrolyzing GMP synthase, partial [Lachnospiraceae bacterium]|nr:glutamine-hydrolyzing GMP synthase [Lachnospiraceae bacterium]